MVAWATLVGVPQTAALGWRAAARASELAPRSATAVTSVARCRTFGSSRTYGASGTFIPEQYGDNARATDETAYSCSSRSLLDCAREAASAKSPIRSPVRRIVPASTREVARPASRRISISGVAPMKPSMAYVQHLVYRAASAVADR